MRRLMISFSGGETSALMTHMLLTKWRDKYDEAQVVFANTGQENDETLDFVHQCDRHFGFGTVWVEAEVFRQSGVGTEHKFVRHATASRNGEPFEAMIRKYGIPNTKFKHCTRELKLRPIDSYLRSIGWENGTYVRAIGIRADEARRRSGSAERDGIIYPLLDWEPTTKMQVNDFWASQPFRLNLTGYQGNCKWCWKKSLRKLLTIADESPEVFDFPARMEREYGCVGHEFSKGVEPGYRRVFFRGNTSTEQLFQMHREAAESGALLLADDDARAYTSQGTLPLDDADGCEESCEVDWSDKLEPAA